MSLVLVHAGYLFCNGHSLNTNYYGTTFCGMPGSFNSLKINACIVRIIGFMVHSLFGRTRAAQNVALPPPLTLRGFEPGTYRMPGKHRLVKIV